MLPHATILADWKPPRSSRLSTYSAAPAADSKEWTPVGVTTHCMTNCGIYCQREDMDKNKGHVSVTIVAIKHEGWAFAPWKKPKNSSVKVAKDPNAKKLAEVDKQSSVGGQLVIGSVRTFLFAREGIFDKGPRDDDSASTLAVGQTLHFGIQSYMYDDKARAIMPAGVAYIPPFTLVEIAFTSNASPAEPKNEGYGIKLECIRVPKFSAYSYLSPQGLPNLPRTWDDAAALNHALSVSGPNIAKMVEVSNVGFFADVHPTAYLVPLDAHDGWYRLVSHDDLPVADGVFQVDISEEDLLRYTNAGDHLGYARLLIDIAIAAGALRVYLYRSEFYNKREPALSLYRGAPFIDTEKLLEGVDVVGFLFFHLFLFGFLLTPAAGPARGGRGRRQLRHAVPGENLLLTCFKHIFKRVFLQVIGMTNPYFDLHCDKKKPLEDGMPLACPDFALCSESCRGGQAYALDVCENGAPILPLFYLTAPGAGEKRAPDGRVNYRALADLKSARKA
jgi:hypothetical protein